MNMTNDDNPSDNMKPETPAPDESGLEALLHEVGPRGTPSRQTLLEVQAAVHAEWRATVAERRKWRRVIGWSAAAGVAALALVVTLSTSLLTSPVQPVGTVTSIDGQLQVKNRFNWTHRAAGTTVLAGETVRTDERSRAAIALTPDLLLRLDRNTVIEIAAADRVRIDSGAVYIDSSGAPDKNPLWVQTFAGTVRHVGTQYEVRVQGDSIDVSVREGHVDISHARGSITGSAGERIHLTSNGETARSEISPRDPAWTWVRSTTMPFDIENQPLAVFLKWVARETGRQLTYASPQAQTVAETLKLKGSIAGLEPEAALAAVLATTQLRQIATQNNRLEIALAGAIDPAVSPRPTP